VQEINAEEERKGVQPKFIPPTFLGYASFFKREKLTLSFNILVKGLLTTIHIFKEFTN